MLHEHSTISPGLRVVAIGGGQVLLDEPAPYDDTELRVFPIPRDCTAGLLVASNDNPHAKLRTDPVHDTQHSQSTRKLTHRRTKEIIWPRALLNLDL